MFSAVKPTERQYGDGVADCGPCLINEARAGNIKKSERFDPSCSNQREGISLDEVEWEIPWEDLDIGARIGIGKNILFFFKFYVVTCYFSVLILIVISCYSCQVPMVRFTVQNGMAP